MTPEIELVLKCAQTRPDAAALRALAERPIDWPRFVELAEWHGLAPLAYWRLQKACPEAVPPDVFRPLGERFRANAERNLFLTGELLRILKLLEAAGVSAVAFKGPVLAWWVYGHPALRSYSDLDILVRLEDVPRARELLCAQGYQPQTALEGPLERTFLRWLGQMPFARADSPGAVDLHWALAMRSCGLCLEGTDLLRVQMGSHQVATFGAENTLLLLAYHGAKHGWAPLNFLCDLAMLIAAVPLDWDRALATAGKLRIKRRLLVGLGLAQELLGVELPVPVLEELRTDRRALKLAAQAREWLLGAVPAPSPSRFQFRAMDCLQDRVRFRLGSIFEPTEADWAALRIPPSLFPLYYLARPVRLLVKHGARQARRLLGRSR